MCIHKGAVKAILMNQNNCCLKQKLMDVLAKDLWRQSGEIAKYNMMIDRILLLRDVKGGAFKKCLRNVKSVVIKVS